MAPRANLKKAFWLFLFLLLLGKEASALTVSGTILDTAGTAVPEIKVCVMDYNPGWFDTERDCVLTNSAGAYSSNKVLKDDDVYLKVYYESPLNAALAPGRIVRAVHDSSSSTLTLSTAGHSGGYLPDLQNNATLNVPSFPGEPAVGPELTGLTAVREVFAYIAAQGVTGYTVAYDVTVDVRVGDPDFWPSASGSTKTINCGLNRINEWATFYHEMGHLIAYAIYNERWPASPYIGYHHTTDAHSDQGFAICEGWAEGVQLAVSGFTGKGTTSLFSSTAWRGRGGIRVGESGPYTHFGEPTGSDNSGEVVEGAIGNIIASANFRYMMEGLVATSPDRYWDLLRGFIGRAGTGPALTGVFPPQRKNGIVYSRAKFTGFEEKAPNSVQVGEGSFAIIDKIAFMRGKVHPKFAQVTAAELNLASGQVIGIDKIEMGWADASDGLTEKFPSLLFSDWSGPVPFAPRSIVFDSVDKLSYDRDLDLILRVQDIHGSWDDFDPNFTGDPVPSSGKDYSSNERWLKRLNTWYNQDNYADNDDEGKVIVDNNDPIMGDKDIRPPASAKKSWLTGGDGTYVRIYPPASRS